MARGNARIAIYTLAGFYLLYLVYEMYHELSAAGSDKSIMIVFMVLFAIVGGALVINGIRHSWLYAKEKSQPKEEEEDTGEDK